MSDDLDDFQININLDEVDDGSEPIQSPKPVCRVHSIQRKMKPGGEYPYFEVVLKATEENNRTAWLNLSLHPKALWNLKLFLEGCGVSYPKGNLNLAGITELVMSCKDKLIGVTNTLKQSDRDPKKKISDIGPPYTAIR